MTSTTESTKTTPTVNPSTPTTQPDWKCTDLELYCENGHFYVRVSTVPEQGHKSIAAKELQLQLWAAKMDLGSYTIKTERNQIIQIEDAIVIKRLKNLVDGSDITGILSTTPTQTNPGVSTEKRTKYWVDRTDLEAALDLATDDDHGLQQALEKANKTEDAKKFAKAIADLRQLKQEISEPSPYTQAKLAEKMEAFRNMLRTLSYEDLGVVLAYHANLPENIIQEPNSRIPAIQHYAFLTYDQIKNHQYLDMIARFDYDKSWRKQNSDPTTANVLDDGRDLFYLTGWSEERTLPVKAGTTPSGIRLAAPFLQQILLGRPVEAKSTDDLKVVDLYAVWSTTKPQNPQGYTQNTHTPALDSQAQRKTSTNPSPTPSTSKPIEPTPTPTPSNSNPTDPSSTPTSSQPAPRPSNPKRSDPSVQPTDQNNNESTGGNDRGMSYDGRKDGLGGSSGSRGRKEAVLFVQRGDRTGNVLSAPANNASQGAAGLNAQNSQVLADQAAAAQQRPNRIDADGQAPGLNQYQNQPGDPVAANNVPQTGERSTIPMILILSLSAILLILKRQRIRP